MRFCSRARLLPLVLLVSSVCLLASQSQVPQASAEPFPSYNMFISIIDFQESDHTANISINFNANFDLKEGKPGLFGLDLTNTWDGMMADNVHQERNGTLLDETTGSWVFNFYVRAHAFGRTEFYPYDSWMFNLTLSTPLLSEANSANLSTGVFSGVPGWTLRKIDWGGAGVFRLNTNSLNWKSVVVTFVLDPASWKTAFVRSIPLVLLLILGMTVMIPPTDLSSRATVHTSIIFFVGALLLNVASSISPIRFALSFGEVSLYYLFLAASFFLMLAVLENALLSRGSSVNPRESKRAQMYGTLLRTVTSISLLSFVWVMPFWFAMSYNDMASTYWWVIWNQWITWVAPAVLSSIGIIVCLVDVALCVWRTSHG